MATDSPSTMDIDGMTPDNRSRRGGSVLSNLDDPDVRIAAEALGDLRAGESSVNTLSYRASYH